MILFHSPLAICRLRCSISLVSLSPSSWCTQAEKFPDAPIYGGSKQVKGITKIVKDADAFSIGSLEVK